MECWVLSIVTLVISTFVTTNIHEELALNIQNESDMVTTTMISEIKAITIGKEQLLITG